MWQTLGAMTDSSSSNQFESDKQGGIAAPDNTNSISNAGIDHALEERIQKIGRDILKHTSKGSKGFFTARYWSEKMMDRAMSDDAFREAMLRFVDVFPSMRDHHDVYDYLAGYVVEEGVTPPRGLCSVLILAKYTGLKRVLAYVASRLISITAHKFIAGTDAVSALPVLEKMWLRDTAFTASLLGETCTNRYEAQEYQNTYIDMINSLADAAELWPENQQCEQDHLGQLPRVNISVKISSLCPNLKQTYSSADIESLAGNLIPILQVAQQRNAQIHVDMEYAAVKDVILDIFLHCAEKIDIPIGVVLQTYLRQVEEDAQKLIDWSYNNKRHITIRLVKGAYYDQEVCIAMEQGKQSPVWSHKHETDACFERVAGMLIDAIPGDRRDGGVSLALGSHNVRSISAVLAMLEQKSLPPDAVELQMLYGMADELKHAAHQLNLRVREYVPIGDMIPGMAYFARRLLENTSNESWLRAGFSKTVPADKLLASPHQAIQS